MLMVTAASDAFAIVSCTCPPFSLDCNFRDATFRPLNFRFSFQIFSVVLQNVIPVVHVGLMDGDVIILSL